MPQGYFETRTFCCGFHVLWHLAVRIFCRKDISSLDVLLWFLLRCMRKVREKKSFRTFYSCALLSNLNLDYLCLDLSLDRLPPGLHSRHLTCCDALFYTNMISFTSSNIKVIVRVLRDLRWYGEAFFSNFSMNNAREWVEQFWIREPFFHFHVR